MPEKMQFMPSANLLSLSEMERLINLLAELGITKVRITGGEPFIRPGVMDFLQSVYSISGIENVHITTNGVSTLPYVAQLADLGISGLNLSLDTLNAEKFYKMTRRNKFAEVLKCLHGILDAQIPLKVNAVIMEKWNTDDILPMAELTRHHPIEMRYIEEMPFNGTANTLDSLVWNHEKILATLTERYPEIQRIPMPPHATSQQYKIPGHQGTVGIIAGFSRTFCGTCNRIRVTASGGMQTCLYGYETLNFRDLFRAEHSNSEVQQMLKEQIGKRFRDGIAAQQHTQTSTSRSMSLIGG